jgi:hypothetical protein
MAIFFSNGANSTKQTVLPRFIFDDILIPIVSGTKLLGVIIDNKLKFDLNSKDVTRRVAYKDRVLLNQLFCLILNSKQYYSNCSSYLLLIIALHYLYIFQVKFTTRTKKNDIFNLLKRMSNAYPSNAFDMRFNALKTLCSFTS